MACKQCQSNRQRRFPTEMNIHFPGREGLNQPTVWVFPEITVCTDCGFAEFLVPTAELGKLVEDPVA